MKHNYSKCFKGFLNNYYSVFTFLLFSAFTGTLRLPGQAITVVYDTAGSYTFTAPPCVTTIQVQCWGGGGGGGGGVSNPANDAGGGGGGGGYTLATAITVVPGNAYSITVGAGGTAATGDAGGNGGNSSFNGTVNAAGGSGGGIWDDIFSSGNGTGGAGGTGGTYNGGSGANGDHPDCGGGGGGGAGSGGNGGNGGGGPSCLGGAAGAGAQPGGVGGAGADQATGSPGIVPGGGGGGAFTANLISGTPESGGVGGPGQVIITYNAPAIPTITSVPTLGCLGSTITIDGTNLSAATSVMLGGTRLTNLAITDTTITGTIQAGTTAGTLTITSPCGSVSSTGPITINPPAFYAYSDTICAGSSYNFNGLSVSIPGLYNDTLPGAAANGCDSIVILTLVTRSHSTVHVNATASQPLFCQGDSTQICASTGFTSYTWNNGDTASCFYALITGSYSVTALLDGACSATANVSVSNTVPINVVTATTDASCNNDNGSATAIISTGTGPFTYLWSNNATTDTALNLAAGAYQVTVTGDQGCSASASVTLSSSNDVSLAATSLNATCGNNNGSAIAVTSSGTPPFTYSWSNSGSTDTISGIGAGSYSVTVTDANGCSASADATVSSANGLSVVATSFSTTCGNTNGSVVAVISSGTSPFTYFWSNSGNSDTISGIGAGTYSVTVTDANRCSGTAEATVNSSSADSVLVTSDKTIMCSGDTAHLCATAGFAQYLWNVGDTTACLATTLGIGYGVTATDNGGCTAVSNLFTVRIYPQLAVSLTVSNDTLSVFNGITYQWYYSNTILPGDTFATLIATQPGEYYVAETDSYGCVILSTEQNISLNGIADLKDKASISIFPNPLQDGNLQILAGEEWIGSRYELYDATGRVVYSSEIRNRQSEIELNIASGIFQVRIYSQQRNYTFKLVKL